MKSRDTHKPIRKHSRRAGAESYRNMQTERGSQRLTASVCKACVVLPFLGDFCWILPITLGSRENSFKIPGSGQPESSPMKVSPTSKDLLSQENAGH